MSLRSLFVIAAMLVFAMAASAQVTTLGNVPEDAFQVSYAANLLQGESYVDMVNDGATGNNNICVSVYGFDNQEELLDCCTCSITPNGLASIPVHAGVLANTLTGKTPSSAVIKLVATQTTTCTVAGAAGAYPTTAPAFVAGLKAWRTTLHAAPGAVYEATEVPFAADGTNLSVWEFNHLQSFCMFINADGTGQGICPGCTNVALGANTKL